MKKGSCASLLCALVVVLVVLAEARVTEAVTCNPMELSACQGSFTSSQPPAAACCNKLREQQPCFCGYKKNPSLGQYVNSPNARRMKKGYSCASLLCALVVVLAVLAEAQVTEAVTCSPVELRSCLDALTSSQPPTAACCDKLREQKPCLCGYIKNPNLGQFVNSPNARRVAATCGVPYPTC
ncbi:hypothetical protein RHSIM_RhsimUnG0246000 [Rhododendron simsii]|uniref:Bifunctional inhibitor/plant lipid transfer protein/seed storage helical domain-containing protein n=1 Tax=Rhododendron simsii TaxID=118357 RepID=A0A834L1Z5_RHOSS|nr:hypothetical protein RHSIM_RhsimUnG0246000 [Rhododendron simsii]